MSKEKETKEPKKSKKAAEPVSERFKLALEVEALVKKKFGEESMRVFGSKPKKVEAIKTGSIVLDMALGIGGLPKGRIIEIYGPEASGKTTLTLHVAAECQKTGGTVAFIDAEHALDPNYAKNIGVDMESLLVAQPDYGEQGLEIADFLIETGKVDLIIVDSVAALTPKAEIEGEMEDQQMGLHARMMSKGLRKLTAKAAKAGTTIIFINQLRLKIGFVMGNPEVTTGGNALKFYASTRLDVRRLKATTGDATKEGIMKVKIVKNKVAAPFVEVEIPVIFGVGINRLEETYALAKTVTGLIEAPHAKHYYKGAPVKLSNGEIIENDPDNVKNVFASKREDAYTFLRTEKAFLDALREQVVSKIQEELNDEDEPAKAE